MWINSRQGFVRANYSQSICPAGAFGTTRPTPATAPQHIGAAVAEGRGRAIRAVNPLLRRVNDRLFQNVSRSEFEVASRFLAKFARNSEDALIEIQRAERERASGADLD